MPHEDISKSIAMLACGSAIVVETSSPSGNKTKFRSIFVGLMPKKFMLIQQPDINRNKDIADKINHGVACTIRSLVEGKEGAVVAFVTSIIRTVQSPAKMILLNIPQKVALQRLRKVTRIDTLLNVEIKNNELIKKAIMANLSTDGCLLNIKKTEQFSPKENEVILFSIIDSDYNDFTEIQGSVCNTKSSKNLDYIGIKFDDTSLTRVSDLVKKIVFQQ